MITIQTDSVQKIDFDQIDIPIPVRQVMRRLGYPPGVNTVEGDRALLLKPAFDMAPDLMKPAGILRMLDIDSWSQTRVTFVGADIVIENDKVAKMLRHSQKAVFFMATIGYDLEIRLQELLNQGDMTEGLALDAIGSETADAVADYIHHDLAGPLAEENGLCVSPRFSPGYGEWGLGIQKEFLTLCQGSQIGISLTDSCLMQPRKSVSAVFGIEKGKR